MARGTFWALFLASWVFLATGWAMGERALTGIAVGIFLTLTVERIGNRLHVRGGS